jgi:iron complex outermembrane receptor protein
LTTFVFNTDAEIKGAEIELQASPIEGMDLILGASYVDNNVEDAYRLPSGETVDRVSVMTPEWTFNGLARYEWPALGGTLAVQGDFNYMDEHFFQLKNSPVGEEDAYTLVNARVSYTSGSGNWKVTAFVDNVTDKEYRVMVFDLSGTPAAGGFGMAENYYGTPRWWGVTLGYNW